MERSQKEASGAGGWPTCRRATRARGSALGRGTPSTTCCWTNSPGFGCRAWLLFLVCAAPRANYLLRVLPPGLTGTFAQAHEAAVLYLAILLLGGEAGQLSPQAQRAVQLPLQSGGLGLRFAEATRHVAYWACWVDALPAIQRRTPRSPGPDCGFPVESCGRGLAGSRHGTRSGPVSARLRFYGPFCCQRCRNWLVRTTRSRTPSAASNVGLRPLAMCARSRCILYILLTLTLHVKRCCCRKPARTLRGHSLCCLQARRSASRSQALLEEFVTGRPKRSFWA